jgi:hypothetical protein
MSFQNMFCDIAGACSSERARGRDNIRTAMFVAHVSQKSCNIPNEIQTAHNKQKYNHAET